MKRKLQKTNKNQFILCIPKGLVEIKGWKKEDDIDFSFSDNGLIQLNNSSKKRRNK